MGMYLAQPRGAFFPTVSGVATVLYAMLTVRSVAWLGYTRLHYADNLRSYTKYITLTGMQPTQCLAHGARLVREAVAVVYIMLH